MPELPVNFKDFKKDPVKALLYMALVAIVALFGYLQYTSTREKKALEKQIIGCEAKNYTQDVEMKQIRTQYIEAIGLLNRVESKLETLKELGQIK